MDSALENLRSVAPHLDDRALVMALGPVMSFSYPPMWQWLRDVLGMTEEEAEQAAVWATRSLVAALASAPPAVEDAGTGAPSERKPRARATRKKR